MFKTPPLSIAVPKYSFPAALARSFREAPMVTFDNKVELCPREELDEEEVPVLAPTAALRTLDASATDEELAGTEELATGDELATAALDTAGVEAAAAVVADFEAHALFTGVPSTGAATARAATKELKIMVAQRYITRT